MYVYVCVCWGIQDWGRDPWACPSLCPTPPTSLPVALMGIQAVGKCPQTLLCLASPSSKPIPFPASPSPGILATYHLAMTSGTIPPELPRQSATHFLQGPGCLTTTFLDLQDLGSPPAAGYWPPSRTLEDCPLPQGFQDVTVFPLFPQSGCGWLMVPTGARAGWKCGTVGTGGPCVMTDGTCEMPR